MNLIPWKRTPRGEDEERGSNDLAMAFNTWANLVAGWPNSFGYNGVQYSLPGSNAEEVTNSFRSLSQGAYKTNGVVFACVVTRMLLFSEARFMFRRLRNGRPGDLFGNADLQPLNAPWPGGTTGDLLSKMLVDADLAGNAFIVKRPGGLRRLRPDWVTIVLGSFSNPDTTAWDADVEVVGYVYTPGGKDSGNDPVTYMADEVAHFAPIPDPEAQFRGMSWLTPLVREIMGDKQMVDHKLAFFENGATPNLVLKMDTDIEKAKPFIDLFKADHEGAMNAYKTIFLGGGADATVVGADLRQLDFKTTQGAGETRIAAAARVPPIIVGLSEGLQAATYSNYGMARRAFADATMRPLWRNVCASLAPIVVVPPDGELWYDDRDITFLQEDQADAANIQATKSTSINTLITAGFTADSVVQAITSGDFTRLQHSGLTSVQLLPPGTPGEPPAADVGPNANPSPPAAAAPAPAGANSVREAQIDFMLDQLLRDTARQPDIHVTVPPTTVEIGEGAIQSHVSLEVPSQEPVRMEIAEGAIQSHVSVEPARMEITEGSVTVQPSDVRVEEGAIQVRVDPADVTVEVGETQVSVPPTVIEEGAIQSHLTVEPTRVEIEEGAIQTSVTVEQPDIQVAPADVRMEIAEGAVQVEVAPADVSVEVAPAEVDVTVERQEIQPVIQVQPTPVEITNEVNLQAPNKTVSFFRDADGNIVEAQTEDTPEDA